MPPFTHGGEISFNCLQRHAFSLEIGFERGDARQQVGQLMFELRISTFARSQLTLGTGFALPGLLEFRFRARRIAACGCRFGAQGIGLGAYNFCATLEGGLPGGQLGLASAELRAYRSEVCLDCRQCTTLTRQIGFKRGDACKHVSQFVLTRFVFALAQGQLVARRHLKRLGLLELRISAQGGVTRRLRFGTQCFGLRAGCFGLLLCRALRCSQLGGSGNQLIVRGGKVNLNCGQRTPLSLQISLERSHPCQHVSELVL